jgi:hypothetical protein
MHLPPHPRANRSKRGELTRRGIAPAVAAFAAAFTIGCASPAPPRPPSLHLPRIPSDLTAERVGDQVRLHWTTSDRTTDSLPAPANLSAEVCRETGPSPRTGADPICTVVTRLPVKPGPSQAAEALPPSLSSGPVTALHYRIRILNGDSRAAGYTKTTDAPSGTGPSPVQALRATSGRTGAVIEWTPSPSPSVVELIRTHDLPPQQVQAKKAAKAAKTSPLDIGDEEPAEVRLRSADIRTHPNAADPGGTVDHTAKRGETYLYRAQRIFVVPVDGKNLKLHSEISQPVTLQNADSFPPSPPAGLAGVPSSSNGHAAIDLSWQPDADIDLAGYNVYRRDADGRFNRVNTAPVTGPAYTDATVAPGTRYIYRVTAVDASGNESAPSTDASETAQAPTP